MPPRYGFERGHAVDRGPYHDLSVVGQPAARPPEKRFVVANRADCDDIKGETIAKVLVPRTRNIRRELELANRGPEKRPALLARLKQHAAPQRSNRQKGHARQPRPAPDIQQAAAALKKRGRRQRIENVALHELLTTRKAHQIVSFGPAL
jgi:hypothetical protein